MKVLNVYLLLWVTLLFVCPVAAQQDVKPMTYEQFKEQKDLQTDKGFYTVYLTVNALLCRRSRQRDWVRRF